MKLEQLQPGKGFDASTYVNPEQARALWDQGYRFRFMYVRRDQHVNERPDQSDGPLTWPVSASRQELEEHLEIGYRVGFFQFARLHGRNYLSAAAGAQLGHNAAWNAYRLTGLEGLSLYTDAEWTDSPPAWMTLPFLRSWGRAASEANQRAACYRAFEGLDGSQWYGLPYFRSYCTSAMHECLKRPPLPRGDCLIQHPQHTECGVTIDKLFCVEDFRDDLPWVVAP